MSGQLTLKWEEVDVDKELDQNKLQQWLEDCEEAEARQRIERRLQALGGGTMTVSKSATRSADVTGELMPFILGQLQASLENRTMASGGGGAGSLLVVSSPFGCSNTSSGNDVDGNDIDGELGSQNLQHNSNSSISTVVWVNGGDIEDSATGEECLFDSGTESGEDVVPPDPPPTPQHSIKKQSSPAEFSTFMEGLCHSLTKDGLGLLSSLSSTQLAPCISGKRQSSMQIPDENYVNASHLEMAPLAATTTDSGLIQQVDNVLTLLRDSLVKDPNCLNQNLKSGTEGTSGSELIDLIDRLKFSLETKSETPGTIEQNSISVLPKEPHPPDLIPSRKLPWTTDMNDGPWKVRAAKKRTLVRSRSIGVSNEELDQARRNMEEEALRSVFHIDESRAVEVVKAAEGDGNNKSQTSTLPQKMKPFRVFSLDSAETISDLSDPSRGLFTPEETVQIAIHKAAINKQMSEEDKRRRSCFIPRHLLPNPVELPTRDFTLTLPKPYVPPGASLASDEQTGKSIIQRRQTLPAVIHRNMGSGKQVTGSPPPSSLAKRSIENVHISLKDSGDIPQLQIAITLNTNPNAGNMECNTGQSGTKTFDMYQPDSTIITEIQSQDSSDDLSKETRYRPKSERKKKLKRANTIDVPQSEFDVENEADESDGAEENFSKNQQPPPTVPKFLEKVTTKGENQEDLTKPSFLQVGDNCWTNRFSSLKTSFESSSKESSPSMSPIPVHAQFKYQSHHPSTLHFKSQPPEHPSNYSPTRAIWVTGNVGNVQEGRPSSIKNKLSVFESKTIDPQSNTHKMPEQWSHLHPIKSSVLQKYGDNLGEKVMEKNSGDGTSEIQCVSKKPHAIGSLAKHFEQQHLNQHPVQKQSTLIYEGVHTVHTTKSALEAMLHRQNQAYEPPPPLPPKPNTFHIQNFQTHGPLDSHSGVNCGTQGKEVLPPPLPRKRNGAQNKSEVENFQGFKLHAPVSYPMNSSGDSENPVSRLSVFGLAKSFDDAVRQKREKSLGQPEKLLTPMKQSASFPMPKRDLHSSTSDEDCAMNLPVVSKVMKGPQQQRATYTTPDLSSLGSDHPSAARVRGTESSTKVITPAQHHHPPPIFPPRHYQFLPLVKSHSGDILGHGGGTRSVNASSSLPQEVVIPKQKSLVDFPIPEQPMKETVELTKMPFRSIGVPKNVSMSHPHLPTTTTTKLDGTISSPTKNSPFVSFDQLKRTSSGSSIFDRAKSLYISSRDAHSIVTPNGSTQPARRKPPSLPKNHSIFPKQYEAQMSPESADKKRGEVAAYFKFQREVPLPPPPPPPSRYTKGKKDPIGFQNQIRKCASQGKIMNRQKSYSDGDDEDDNVDQIFESLFKASVESKIAKTVVSGDTTSSEIAQMKEAKSATQSKTVEKSASVQESKTPTGSTSVAIKKQSSVSKSSYSTSSSMATTTKTTTASSPFSKFKELDDQASGGRGGKYLFKFTNPALKTSLNSAKDGLLAWCQGRTREYENVKIENFTSSWSDGLAFCALIHHFFKDSFDYNSLLPTNTKYNFELAFRIADEKAGIYPLLDPEDMVAMGRKPDWKCVFTYVQTANPRLSIAASFQPPTTAISVGGNRTQEETSNQVNDLLGGAKGGDASTERTPSDNKEDPTLFDLLQEFNNSSEVIQIAAEDEDTVVTETVRPVDRKCSGVTCSVPQIHRDESMHCDISNEPRMTVVVASTQESLTDCCPVWTCTRGSDKVLSLHFGITVTAPKWIQKLSSPTSATFTKVMRMVPPVVPVITGKAFPNSYGRARPLSLGPEQPPSGGVKSKLESSPIIYSLQPPQQQMDPFKQFLPSSTYYPNSFGNQAKLGYRGIKTQPNSNLFGQYVAVNPQLTTSSNLFDPWNINTLRGRRDALSPAQPSAVVEQRQNPGSFYGTSNFQQSGNSWYGTAH